MDYNLTQEENPLKKLNLLFGNLNPQLDPSNLPNPQAQSLPTPPSSNIVGDLTAPPSPIAAQAPQFTDKSAPNGFASALTDQTPVKKPGLFDNFFGNKQEAAQTDEYGLQKPAQNKLSMFAKILGVALPTIYGATKGMPLYGALSGINSLGKTEENQNKMFNDSYLKNRTLAQTALNQKESHAQTAAAQALTKSAQDITKEHYANQDKLGQSNLGLNKEKVNIERTKANSPTKGLRENKDEKYINLMNRVGSSGVNSLTPGERDWLSTEFDRRKKVAGEQ